MNVSTRLKGLVRRPPVVIASLLILAVVAFWFVNRLVNRFGEQKKALARHLFQKSQEEIRAGQFNDAIDDLRASLDYDPNNFDYELTLARVLRDTSKNNPSQKNESETYLIGLWEHDPQNSVVNLAIARLYAGENLIEKALQYYHNAIYGVWPANAPTRRLDTELELIHFLLKVNADPQAQAELISWASGLPADTDLRLTIAGLFAQAKDYEHALGEYQKVMRSNRNNAVAIAGAGNSAFQLGRYRTAQRYLSDITARTAVSPDMKKELATVNTLLEADPYAQHISNREIIRRSVRAFNQAGTRLADCIQQKQDSAEKQPAIAEAAKPPSATPLDALKDLDRRWLALKPKIRGASANNIRDSAMDITFDIEQQTASICGPPAGLDEALILLSQNPIGAER